MRGKQLIMKYNILKNNIGIFIASSFLAGCVSPQYNYQPTEKNLSYPKAGIVTTASVGENMLAQGLETLYDAIYVSNEIPTSLVYTITPGYFIKTGQNKNGSFYKSFNGNESGNVRALGISDPWEAIYVKNNGKICVISIYNYNRCTRNNGFKKVSYKFASPKSFQNTLIYSGRIGNKIKIGYREFSENLARPAFNNEAEYDITESKEIGYKGAIIEVIDATNSYIKYKLINNFTRSYD